MDFGNILDGIFNHLNNIRNNPKQSAHALIGLEKKYKGNLYGQNVKTREGVIALRNLIQELMVRQPTNRLKWSFALHMAADEQASRLGQLGLVTTQGTPYHVTLPQRCKKYGIVRGRLSELYEFGGKTPQEILQWLLIDDGLLSRKRRTTLLDPIFNFIGVGSSLHQVHGTVTVVILSQDIISLVAPQKDGKYRLRCPFPQGKQTHYQVKQEVIIENILGQYLPKKKQIPILYNQVQSQYPKQQLTQYEFYKNQESNNKDNMYNRDKQNQSPGFILDSTPRLSPSNNKQQQQSLRQEISKSPTKIVTQPSNKQGSCMII